jgi:hypothetical protein
MVSLASFRRPIAQAEQVQAQICSYPAGWRAYRVTEVDTLDGLALRYGLSVEQLLQSNCLLSADQVLPGLVIYLPSVAPTVSVQTILPLGVSSLQVEPMVVNPGGRLVLSWAAQGPVQTVRLGALFNGQYFELAKDLPFQGAVELRAPDDGREAISYVVLVGDGYQEVAAQATVRILCRESWFFLPAPAGCPSSLLVTSFQAQSFERGVILYVPALGLHYVLVTGQEAVEVDDNYIPGMPDYDPGLIPPPNTQQPRGAIFHLWHNESVRAALGYATGEAVTYLGMMQRSVSSGGEVSYLSASNGDVYRLGDGLVWETLIID